MVILKIVVEFFSDDYHICYPNFPHIAPALPFVPCAVVCWPALDVCCRNRIFPTIVSARCAFCRRDCGVCYHNIGATRLFWMNLAFATIISALRAFFWMNLAFATIVSVLRAVCRRDCGVCYHNFSGMRIFGGVVLFSKTHYDAIYAIDYQQNKNVRTNSRFRANANSCSISLTITEPYWPVYKVFSYRGFPFYRCRQ